LVKLVGKQRSAEGAGQWEIRFEGGEEEGAQRALTVVGKAIKTEGKVVKQDVLSAFMLLDRGLVESSTGSGGK